MNEQPTEERDDEPTEPETNRNGLTLEELRAIGSAEANAWTITPPGGPTMSLSEAAEYNAKQEAEKQKDLAILREEMEQERRERGLA